MATIINASTSNGLIQTADTSGVLELQSGGTTIASVSSTGVAVTGSITATGQIAALKSGTAVASTSGTSIDFTGIPSWVERITLMLSGFSTSGTSYPIVQLGSSSGGIDTAATYASGVSTISGASANSTGSSTLIGFYIAGPTPAAAVVLNGIHTFANVTGNLWVHSFSQGTAGGSQQGGGSKTISSTLDRIRITTVNGTDTFDAGTINILYE
jgi:hypothetical protein